MTLTRLKYAALGLGVIFIMSFLYIKTQEIDLDKHNQLLDLVSQFKQVDAVLNQHILEIRQGLLPFYDPTVGDITELEQLLGKMGVILRDHLCLKNYTLVSQQADAVEQMLSQKTDLLEIFKSSNALLRNSLRYLPVAIPQINARLPPGAQGTVLRQTLNALLRDILIYNTTSDAGLEAALYNSTDILKRETSQLPLSMQDDLRILLSHADIVLENKKQANALVQELVNLPTTQRMDDLLRAYIADHKRMMREVNTYRQVLYIFSVLLLACIAYILFRLNRTAVKLRQTVTDLNYQKFAMDQHAIVSIADKDGNITYANQKFCEINQCSAEELIGQNHRLAKSDYHPASFYKDLWDTITRGDVWHGQIQNKAADGSTYWTDTTIVPFLDNQGAPYQYVAIRTDITGIKQAELTLRESEGRLRLIHSQVPGVVYQLRIDSNGKKFLPYVSAAVESYIGLSAATVIADAEKWFALTHPDDFPGLEKSIIDSMLNLSTWSWQGRFIRPDGKTVWLRGTATPERQEDGSTLWNGLFVDISEYKQIEEALHRSQKMDAIGQLSGGIAHDFNNQLGVILGYLDFLQDYVTENAADDEQPRKWVATATRATLRCSDLTRQLLAFSRRQAKQKITVDLNTTISELETMIARSITPEVEVQYFLADELWPIEIDPGELQDALLNLVINARDAMPDGGKLLVETSHKHLDEDYATLNPEAEAGDYVQLMLSDTGTGMNKETLERVFEPFFTTKAEGKGTGLGMAMVYGFVKRYAGHIKIYSEPGMGTTIRLYFPRATTSESVTPVEHPQGFTLPTGDESILIVDDESDLLQLAERYLRDLGYRTRSAENAAQALSVLESDEQIDLLFSDVVMPGGMNGYELAQQAVKLKPGLRVLLTSGFTSKAIANNGLTRFADHLLGKPYRKNDLAQHIRLVLDETPDSPT